MNLCYQIGLTPWVCWVLYLSCWREDYTAVWFGGGVVTVVTTVDVCTPDWTEGYIIGEGWIIGGGEFEVLTWIGIFWEGLTTGFPWL